MNNIAPIRNAPPESKPWEGNCTKKPWDYKVTAVVPHLDTPDLLKLAVSLLRLQTEKPFICVIDTGSTPDNFAEIQNLAGEDLEIHSLRLNGCRHPSDFVAMACDLAHALCRTPYLYHTHADVFLRKRTVISELLELCKNNPAVGYQITERQHKDWVGMVGHSCLIYDVSIIDNLGITWSQRRLCGYFQIEWKPSTDRPNWPDTEVGFNYLLRDAGIVAKIIGTEENFCRNINEHFDHCRTATSSKLYCPEYWEKCQNWLLEAMREAEERIKSWKYEDEFQKHFR